MSKTISILFICMSALSLAAQQEQAVAERILTTLYDRTGNYQVPRPAVQVIEGSELVAAYLPQKNTIFIEKKAIEVTRSFGKDSLSALAFLLGHELTHCFQEIGWATNFLAYDKSYKGSAAKERTADIQGAFCAKLAGFNTLELIQPLIDRLYDAYQLKGITLTGYPTMEDRKSTSGNVEELIDELWHIYQMANYLTVVGNYAVAAQNYEYILEYYIGREVYNNLGILYALQAMNFSGKNVDPYIYPFELSPKTRLERTRAERLTPAEQQTRRQLLENARKYFEASVKLHPSYIPVQINLLGLQVQEGRYLTVIQQYESGQTEAKLKLLGASPKQLAEAQLIAAIAYTISGAFNPDHLNLARSLYTELSNSSNLQIQQLATLNARILDQNLAAVSNPTECSFERVEEGSVEEISPLSYLQKRGIFLKGEPRVELYWEDLDQSTIYVSRWRGKSLIFQQIDKGRNIDFKSIKIGEDISNALQQLDKGSYEILSIGKNSYIHFPACRLIIFADKNNVVEEWIRYFD